jgi:hypothetical protein
MNKEPLGHHFQKKHKRGSRGNTMPFTTICCPVKMVIQFPTVKNPVLFRHRVFKKPQRTGSLEIGLTRLGITLFKAALIGKNQTNRPSQRILNTLNP